MWQDILFAIGSLVFLLGLLPAAISSKVELPRMTTVPTALMLAAYAFAYYTLGLMYTTIMTALLAAVWLFLAIRRGPKNVQQKLDEQHDNVWRP